MQCCGSKETMMLIKSLSDFFIKGLRIVRASLAISYSLVGEDRCKGGRFPVELLMCTTSLLNYPKSDKQRVMKTKWTEKRMHIGCGVELLCGRLCIVDSSVLKRFL